MKKHNSKNDIKPLSLMSLLLSFLSLFVISGILFLKPGSATRDILIDLDLVICSLFLLQWVTDFIRAKNKKKYFRYYWVDLLASIPVYEALRFARIFQIFRVIRIIRSGKRIFKEIQKNRREATMASILLLLVLFLTLGSSLMLLIEGDAPGANIHSGQDALWWAFVTISTVGYGDHYPVTPEGRLLATIIIICGVGIFGMISGLITSIIYTPGQLNPKKGIEHNHELLEKIVTQQESILLRIDKLEEKINKLE